MVLFYGFAPTPFHTLYHIFIKSILLFRTKGTLRSFLQRTHKCLNYRGDSKTPSPCGLGAPAVPGRAGCWALPQGAPARGNKGEREVFYSRKAGAQEVYEVLWGEPLDALWVQWGEVFAMPLHPSPSSLRGWEGWGIPPGRVWQSRGWQCRRGVRLCSSVSSTPLGRSRPW